MECLIVIYFFPLINRLSVSKRSEWFPDARNSILTIPQSITVRLTFFPQHQRQMIYNVIPYVLYSILENKDSFLSRPFYNILSSGGFYFSNIPPIHKQDVPNRYYEFPAVFTTSRYVTVTRTIYHII